MLDWSRRFSAISAAQVKEWDFTLHLVECCTMKVGMKNACPCTGIARLLGVERKDWCFHGSTQTRLCQLDSNFTLANLFIWDSLSCFNPLARQVRHSDLFSTGAEMQLQLFRMASLEHVHSTETVLDHRLLQRCREALKEENGDLEKEGSYWRTALVTYFFIWHFFLALEQFW